MAWKSGPDPDRENREISYDRDGLGQARLMIEVVCFFASIRVKRRKETSV